VAAAHTARSAKPTTWEFHQFKAWNWRRRCQ
jgi:hypothetical protein